MRHGLVVGFATVRHTAERKNCLEDVLFSRTVKNERSEPCELAGACSDDKLVVVQGRMSIRRTRQRSKSETPAYMPGGYTNCD